MANCVINRRLRALAACALLTLLACAAERGRLIVIGGGLQSGNARVLERCVGIVRKDRTIAIAPTASAAPQAAAADAAGQLGRYTSPARLTTLDDAAPLESLRRAGGLFFTGGDQSRVTARFRPGGTDTPERRAMLRLLRSGGAISGTSAGAAMMSDPMFTGGDSDAPPELGRGMGFFPYGLVDSHFFSRGRLGRLLAALAVAQVRYGFGVADDRAIEVELARDRIVALGDRAALIVDVVALRRDGASHLGSRITLLSDGDVFDVRAGAVQPGHGRTLAPPRQAQARGEDALPEAWGRDVILERLERLAQSGQPAQAASRAFFVTLRADAQTRFSFAGDGRLLTAVDVIVDLRPRLSAAAG